MRRARASPGAGRREGILNQLYLGIGGAIVIALIAALIGPYFVDWSAYRAVFETEAARVLGEEVRVRGKAEATLLPSPSLTFTDVVVGPEAAPKMTVERFDIDIALTPLLKGEVRVQEMALEKPVLRAVIDGDGRLDWLHPRAGAGPVNPESVILEHVEMHGGTVTVEDRRVGREWTAADVSMLLEARALLGPYRIEAGFRQGGELYTVRAATGKAEDDGTLRLKLAVTPSRRPVSLTADGVLSRAEALPTYAGKVEIAEVVGEDGGTVGRKGDREGPRDPWRLEAQFDLDPERLLFSALEVRRGGAGQSFGITGTAQVAFGATPRFDAVLSSRQIDLDRSLGAGPEAPTDIPAAMAALASFLTELPQVGLPGRVGFDVPAIVVGGGIVQDVRFDAATEPRGGWHIETLEAQFPGQTRLTANGKLAVQPTPAFDGRVTLDAPQPAAFAAWWRGADEAPAGRQVPLGPITLASNIALRPHTVILAEMTGSIEKAALSGFLGWTEANADKRAFTADLDADRLDLDQLRALVELMAPEGGGGDKVADSITVTLTADAVIVEGVEMKDVSTALAYDADRLKIERLEIGDAAGARVSAKGRIDGLSTAPDGGIALSIDARDLAGLARVVADVVPDNPLADALGSRARSLSPAKLEGSIEAARNAEGSRIAARLGGSVGGSALSLEGRFNGRVDSPDEAETSLDLALDNPDARVLMAQVGAPGLPVELGAGSLRVTASGIPAKGLAGKADLELGGASLGVDGRVVLAAGALPRYAATVSGKAADVVPLALAAGLALPGLGEKTPASVAFAVDGEGAKAKLAGISGALGGRGFSGAATLDRSRGPLAVSGELAVDEVDLVWLVGLEVGGAAVLDTGLGDAWPEAAFADHPIGDADVTLAVRAKRAFLPLGLTVADAAFSLRTRAAESAIDGFSGALGGGRFDGRLALRRGNDGATLSGTARLAGGALEEFVWRRDGSPVASGLLDFSAEFEGTGRSFSGVVAALGGGGSFTVREATLRGVNPVAFSSVIRAADAGLELTTEKVRTVFAGHLDAGSLDVAEASGAFAITGGVIRARNVSVSAPSATTLGGVAVDLNTMTIDSAWTLAVDPGDGERVAGADPQVGIAFTGPIDAPARQIDATAFTGYLTVRAFEREVRRIEEMQADILEKERFAREARRLRELEARREREAKAAAEAEARRKAEEARRRAEEDAARKAAEEAERRRRAADEANRPALPGPLILVPDTAPKPGMSGDVPPASGAPLQLSPIR